MPTERYEACPACGWTPTCAFQRDDRDLDADAVHERVVEHVRQTDDARHDAVALPEAE